MNESETQAEYIDPMLKASGWGDVERSKIHREFRTIEGVAQTKSCAEKLHIEYTFAMNGKKIYQI